MERYQRGKVYRIVCRKTGKQYIGSTCKKLLSQRLANHVCNFKAWKKNRYQFTTSFTILKENDYYIELIEMVSCSSKDELLIRERFHIQKNECVNKYIPLRTQKEYYEDNKEKNKEYREANKEKISEYQKEYAQTNKEKIAENKKEYDKEYRQQNCDKITENFKKKYDCSCGSTLCKGDKSRHEKTIKHQNYLKNIASKSLGENITIEYADCV